MVLQGLVTPSAQILEKLHERSRFVSAWGSPRRHGKLNDEDPGFEAVFGDGNNLIRNAVCRRRLYDDRPLVISQTKVVEARRKI